MRKFRLGAVYDAPPIFNANVEDMGYVEPADLNLTTHLLVQLEEWNMLFQQTFSDEYPPDSGFESVEAREKHNARGAALAVLLQNELKGDAVIEFRPLK